MDKGKLEAWSDTYNSVKINDKWFDANEEFVDLAKEYGRYAIVKFENQGKELTKLVLIKVASNQKQQSSGKISEEVAIRMSALKSATQTVTESTTMTTIGFLNRAKEFEKYIRGE